MRQIVVDVVTRYCRKFCFSRGKLLFVRMTFWTMRWELTRASKRRMIQLHVPRLLRGSIIRVYILSRVMSVESVFPLCWFHVPVGAALGNARHLMLAALSRWPQIFCTFMFMARGEVTLICMVRICVVSQLMPVQGKFCSVGWDEAGGGAGPVHEMSTLEVGYSPLGAVKSGGGWLIPSSRGFFQHSGGRCENARRLAP